MPHMFGREVTGQCKHLGSHWGAGKGWEDGTSLKTGWGDWAVHTFRNGSIKFTETAVADTANYCARHT